MFILKQQSLEKGSVFYVGARGVSFIGTPSKLKVIKNVLQPTVGRGRCVAKISIPFWGKILLRHLARLTRPGGDPKATASPILFRRIACKYTKFRLYHEIYICIVLRNFLGKKHENWSKNTKTRKFVIRHGIFYHKMSRSLLPECYCEGTIWARTKI